MDVIITILQEMVAIIVGATQYLPSTTITIGVAIGLILLIYFRHTLGGLVTGILVTILIAHSFFSQGDIYQISMVRAIAGIVLGLAAFLTDFYFLVRTLVDWRD